MTTPKDMSNNCAALRTRRAARLVSRIYDDALRPLGLKITQLSLLAAIKVGAPDSITAFADMMAFERTTLTRNLQLLEKKGLIEISPEGYRRTRSITLSSAGQIILVKALPEWQKAQDQIEKRLGADQWLQTKGSLEEFVNILR